jgi:hypothetical protein
VVHLLGLFNLTSPSPTMDNDFKVAPVNHYALDLSNRHGKVIAPAPQVDEIFILD